MRSFLCIAGSVLVASLSACSSSRTQISAASLATQARQDPMDHLVYVGGDVCFYYIDRAAKTTNRYKVLRTEVRIPDSYLDDVLPPAVLREATTRSAG